ncbi:CBS domain-containing protein, partial [Enterobacter cloacae complex sp.6722787]|uniref:CBS domain-containing protein n=1 Tax=Enterobacter cloacae complex sp.6722787 TaxID=3397174 RepID=UPI003AAEBF90
IMTSSHDVDYLAINKSSAEIIDLMEKNPHSRFVVVDESISDDPIGVVYVLDLVKQQLSGEQLNLRALVTQPLIFPEGLSLLKALEQFRKAHTH